MDLLCTYIVLGTLRWHILENIFCSGLFWGYTWDTVTKMAHYGATLRLGGDTIEQKKLLKCHLMVPKVCAIIGWTLTRLVSLRPDGGGEGERERERVREKERETEREKESVNLPVFTCSDSRLERY